MSKKHNAKHLSRGISNYPQRLKDRGESPSTVRMPFYDKDGKSHDNLEAAKRRGLQSQES